MSTMLQINEAWFANTDKVGHFPFNKKKKTIYCFSFVFDGFLMLIFVFVIPLLLKSNIEKFSS